MNRHFQRKAMAACLAVGVVLSTVRPALAEDLWTPGWKKSLQNPVLSLSEKGAFDSENIFAPCIAKHEGRYFLYYAGGPSGPRTKQDYLQYQLGLATSDDGIHFKKHGQPLLPLGERDNFHATPTLLRNANGDLLVDPDGTWHMLFSGNRDDDVEHATSRDGVKWQKDPRSPIFRNAYAPNVLKVDGEYRMYHIHKPAGGSWEIHLAVGPDLYSLKPHPANPVLVKSQSWESGTLVYPYVLRAQYKWVMFYAGYWKSKRTAIGVATSADGIRWTKCLENPVLTPTDGSSYDSVYTSSQSVIRDGDVFRLVHKYFSIGLATKPAND